MYTLTETLVLYREIAHAFFYKKVGVDFRFPFFTTA